MIRLPVTLSILPALLCVLTASTAKESPPAAMLVGGESVPATLEGLAADGRFRFATPPGERTIAADRLVRWGNPVEPDSGRLVVLADGSIITAVEWGIGPRDQPLVLENAALTFAPSLFKPLTVPRRLVRGVLLQLPADSARRDQLLDQAHTYAANEDAVLLTGGDRLMGRIDKLNGEAVSLETSVGPVDVPLSRVRAVLFDSSLAALSAGSHILIGLSDGSLLSASEVSPENDILQIKLSGEAVLQGASARDIVSLQPEGHDVTYLSDVEPHRFVHVPYLDLPSPLERDRNVLGSRLRAGGRLFSKGLGVRSGARLIYRLDGTHVRFAALAAIDDSADKGGSAIFRVLLAENDAWREAFTSPVTRGGDEPVPISVTFGEAKGIALVVDYADRGDELDHANWLDARLE